MTRAELAALQLRGAHGYDDPQYAADEPRATAPAVPTSSFLVQLTVANLASISLNAFDITDMDAAVLPTNVASPTLADYKRIIKYLATNPSMLIGLQFQSSEDPSTGAPLLSSLKIAPERKTPFGLTCSNETLLAQYQTSGDYQPQRASLPITTELDGLTYLKITSGVNNSGGVVTINMTVYIGQRAEARQVLQPQAPVVVQAGGRGLVQVAPPSLRRLR